MKGGDSLANAAMLLSVSKADLERALTHRVVAARGDVVEKGHTVEHAEYAKDAFAKVGHQEIF